MKASCTPEFDVTLQSVGLTYQDWTLLCRRTASQRLRRTHWVRQFVRNVQRVHTGGGMWYGGRYVTRHQGGMHRHGNTSATYRD
mgnify:CR=1 FL=1